LQRYGPWAVVTGASDGIGRAFAVELAALGFNLVLVARRRILLDQLAAELQTRHGISTQVIAADMAERGSAQALSDATASLDVGLLVAGAGYGTSGLFLDADLSAELDMLEVNCRAVLEQAHFFGTRVKARSNGCLVLLSSLVGWQGVPHAAHYAATKAWVQSLAEGLRVEWAPHGIDVLALAPGPVASGFGARARMQLGLASSPETVVRTAMRSLGGRGTIVPGLLSKVLTYSLATLPRRGRVMMMGKIMQGMTRHHHADAPRQDPQRA
jgi:short-subunit dehydrogenase